MLQICFIVGESFNKKNSITLISLNNAIITQKYIQPSQIRTQSKIKGDFVT